MLGIGEKVDCISSCPCLLHRAHSRGCHYSSGKVIFCGDITLVMLQNDQITTRPDIETRFIHLEATTKLASFQVYDRIRDPTKSLDTPEHSHSESLVN